MKLSDKIILLRKQRGWSQEALAEQLGVSRQAVSRWEGGTALPDAANILQLSKLFAVSADYLLNDDCEHSSAPAGPAPASSTARGQTLALLVTLEVVCLLLQLAALQAQNEALTLLSLAPFAAVIGGFEFAIHRYGITDAAARAYRIKFYQITIWLGGYLPVRLLLSALARVYPRPYPNILFEPLVLAVYLAAALLCTHWLGRHR